MKYKEALEAVVYAKISIEAEIGRDDFNAIETALKICHRLETGNVSGWMIAESLVYFDNHYDGKKLFRKMAKQLLKEEQEG